MKIMVKKDVYLSEYVPIHVLCVSAFLYMCMMYVSVSYFLFAIDDFFLQICILEQIFICVTFEQKVKNFNIPFSPLCGFPYYYHFALVWYICYN